MCYWRLELASSPSLLSANTAAMVISSLSLSLPCLCVAGRGLPILASSALGGAKRSLKGTVSRDFLLLVFL
jgi:hypothetical protein